MPTVKPSSTEHEAKTANPRQPRIHRRSIALVDVDHARPVFSKFYGDAHLEPLLGLPFSYAQKVTSYGSVHMATEEFASGGSIVVNTINDVYILSRTIVGTIAGEQAGQRFAGVAGRGYMLFSPGLHGALQVGLAHRAQNVTMDRAAIEAHWTVLTGERWRKPTCFEVELDVSQPRAAAITGLADLFRQELEHPDPSFPTLSYLRDALFTAILTGAVHDARGRLDAPMPRIAPGSVRRVEEYIAAHATEAITLEDLVAVAGVPARLLHSAFRQFRQTTPMAFLREKRLEIARKMLLDTNTLASVTTVARDVGLGHRGRFSIEYKRRFGESPSETIARIHRG